MEPDEAIPTGDDNSIGTPAPAAAAPQQAQGDNEAVGQQAIPTGDDNAMPEGPVQQQPDQQPQQKRFGPLGKLVSYLMGEGAVHPQVLQQAAEQIDPEAGMSASDRNLMVVHDAATRGGPDAAWKIMQANRVAYNAKQAFGYAALNGNQQKPPDVKAAVDAANQAADHVLDGSHAQFMVSRAGQITATVKTADGKSQVFDLSPDQFRQYMNVGGAGQYDKQMQQGGIARTLTNITQNQQRVSSVANTPPLKGAAKLAPTAAIDDGDGDDDQGASPTMSAGASAPPVGRSAGEGEYDQSLQRKAWGMFPGAGSQKERAEWMAAQQSATDALKNKVDIADSNAEARTKAAELRAKGGVDQQTVKNQGGLDIQAKKNEGFKYSADAKRAAAQIAADQKSAQQGSKDAQARISEARKAIAVKRQTAGKLTPEDEALEKQLTASATGGQQPQRQAPAQQQAPASPGAPPVQGARFYKGQWYTRGANGEAVPYPK